MPALTRRRVRGIVCGCWGRRCKAKIGVKQYSKERKKKKLQPFTASGVVEELEKPRAQVPARLAQILEAVHQSRPRRNDQMGAKSKA